MMIKGTKLHKSITEEMVIWSVAFCFLQLNKLSYNTNIDNIA